MKIWCFTHLCNLNVPALSQSRRSQKGPSGGNWRGRNIWPWWKRWRRLQQIFCWAMGGDLHLCSSEDVDLSIPDPPTVDPQWSCFQNHPYEILDNLVGKNGIVRAHTPKIWAFPLKHQSPEKVWYNARRRFAYLFLRLMACVEDCWSDNIFYKEEMGPHRCRKTTNKALGGHHGVCFFSHQM